MTTNLTTPERKRRRYNRIVFGFYAVGIVALLAGLQFGYELVGSVGYLLGIVGGVASGAYARRRADVRMTDERDRHLARRAGYLTMLLVATGTLAVFPVLFVLDAAGVFTFTPVLEGVLYTVSGIGLLWGVSCLAVKYVL